MEPVWYFISRAVGTLIPILLVSYAAGLWTGWIKWHTWKREYNEVERDYHKLHDIHDVARATIPELEQRRQALTEEIQQKEDALERIREANEKYEEESQKLNQSLRATKRNYEAMEDIWRGKIAAADIRIIELETALKYARHGGTGREGRDLRDEKDEKDEKDQKDQKDEKDQKDQRTKGQKGQKPSAKKPLPHLLPHIFYLHLIPLSISLSLSIFYPPSHSRVRSAFPAKRCGCGRQEPLDIQGKCQECFGPGFAGQFVLAGIVGVNPQPDHRRGDV